MAQVGSLFSADAWNNIGFTAGEVKNPKRDVALSMAFGTIIVITLYVLANLAYLCALPLAQIQNAPDGRVATAALSAVFGAKGAVLMAVAIIISTFGCNNGLILAGSRVAYAMAKDGLFFRATGTLNDKGVPGTALVYQGIWISVLILLRTRTADGGYGNLYNDLLDYVVFAVLLFYVLTIAGIFVLRRSKPDAERPYKAFGYPIVPLLYIVAATGIMVVLLLYRTQTAGAGMGIVLIGLPVYWWWSRRNRRNQRQQGIRRIRQTQKEELHGQPLVCDKVDRLAAERGGRHRRTQPEASAWACQSDDPWDRRHHWRGYFRADGSAAALYAGPGDHAVVCVWPEWAACSRGCAMRNSLR